MANVILAYSNLADAAALSGGSYETALPLANLQERRLAKKARTTDCLLESTKLGIDLGSAQAVNACALVAHNLTEAAQVRVRGNTSADFTTPAYDSGWLAVWPAAGDSGKYTGIAMAVPDAAETLQYWQIEVDDQTNPAGYVEYGRLFVAGAAWRPENNADYGWAIGYEDPSIIETSISGAEYFDEKPKYRVLRFGVSWLQEPGVDAAFSVSRVTGVTKEVLAIWDKDSPARLRNSFLGRLRTLSPMENNDPLRYATQWEIKETVDTLAATISPIGALVVIDDFSTANQSICLNHSLGAGGQASDSAASSGSIGGYRTIWMHDSTGVFEYISQMEAGPGTASSPPAMVFVDHSAGTFESPINTATTIIWDGGSSTTVNTTGLGAIDLTSGGGNTIRVTVFNVVLSVSLTMRLWSNAGAIDAGVGQAIIGSTVDFPLSDYIGAGVDVTAVGAIQLEIAGDDNHLVAITSVQMVIV